MNLLTRDDKNFPKNLKDISPKVSKLFYKGNYSKKLFEKSIAVVGSRKMTSYGTRILESLLPPLVNAKITIISGFMYGIDQEAHKIALENEGKTVAVLGWGIDWPVEPADKKLYERIENKGLLLSEYQDSSPQLWMFPRRNRIMAGLAQATLVIEAAPNSGSLITAAFATKYKKKLFAVPGPATSIVSQGTNTLIKKGLAKLVSTADDILTEMNWSKTKKTQPIENKNPDILLQLLSREPLNIDEIALSLNSTVEKISVKLSLLQLKGLIAENNGKYYSKSA